MVRTNTIQFPSSDAAVIRIKGTNKALAMTLDGNGRYCKQDPRRGAQIAVAESCRNLVCAGAVPLAATNCLNFGNPEKPEIMWQFSEVIDGMAAACRIFDTPVTGGNVSFYNETLGEGIYPTPVIGMVGLIEPVTRVTSSWFRQDGQIVALLGRLTDSSEEYARTAEDALTEYLQDLAKETDVYTAWANRLPCPLFNLEEEKAVQNACLEGIRSGVITSAHDCSEGGLAVALAEMSFSSFRNPAHGATIRLPAAASPGAALFGEYQSRILVTLELKGWKRLEAIAAKNTIGLLKLGAVGGDRLRIELDGQMIVDEPVAEVEDIWRRSLGHYFERSV
jgi:phosphoribosylformylglycinamidine synthase